VTKTPGVSSKLNLPFNTRMKGNIGVMYMHIAKHVAAQPNTSSKLSYKTVLSAKKKPLNILPIRNLMNLKKNKINKSLNKNIDDNKKKESTKKGKRFTVYKNKDNI